MAVDNKIRELMYLVIQKKIEGADDISSVLYDIADDIKLLLNCERISIYIRNPQGNNFISVYADNVDKYNIPLVLNTSSIAGFSGFFNVPLKVKNVYDEHELKAINPSLSFSDEYDKKLNFKSRSMIVVPISRTGDVIGLIQVINALEADEFSKCDYEFTKRIASLLSRSFAVNLGKPKTWYQYLVDNKDIDPDELERCANEANFCKHSTADLIMKKFNVNRFDIANSFEKYYLIPFHHYDADMELPLELIKSIKKDFFTENKFLPIIQNDDIISILLSDPSDKQTLDIIHDLFKNDNLNFFVGFQSDIDKYLDSIFEEGIHEQKVDINNIERLSLAELVKAVTNTKSRQSLDERGLYNKAITQIVDKILVTTYYEKASDIHLEPINNGIKERQGRVRFRVDASCKEYYKLPDDIYAKIINRFKILTNCDVTETRVPQDGKGNFLNDKNEKINFRISILLTVMGESAIIRLLNNSIISFEDIFAGNPNRGKIEKAIEKNKGLVLLSGPTGSGKTTTIHSILQRLNQPDVKVISVEDPVEIVQNRLQQVQINEKTGMTFPKVLRAFLRSDPDIIFVGEVRDTETMALSAQASLTGHLVISTIHANSALETLKRLRNLGLTNLQIADSINCVIAQRLVQKLCDHCKRERTINKQTYDFIKERVDVILLDDHHKIVPNETKIYSKTGCERCNNLGYSGRLPVLEVLYLTERLVEAIFDDRNDLEIAKLAKEEGMRSLSHDCLMKILEGNVDLYQLNSL